MTPEEALDLLPLLVADDLDEATRDEVRSALAGRDVAAELASWEELEGLLERGLAPAPQAPALRCPFCRDSVRPEERVLCGVCLTPHHRTCFAENEGCSLLGCGGTRAVAALERASVLCPSCSGEAPAGAPFCPWCRRKLAPARPPRHIRRRLGSHARVLGAFAASLLVLLPGGLAVGFFAERELERTWWAERGSLQALGDEAEARAIARSVIEAQRAYRARGFKGGDYSPDLAGLLPLLAEQESWRRAPAARFAIVTEASLSRPDERFFVTVSRPGCAVFSNHERRMLRMESGLAVDRVLCALGPAPSGDPRDEARATLERAIRDLNDRWAAEQDRSSERARRLERERGRLEKQVDDLRHAVAPREIR